MAQSVLKTVIARYKTILENQNEWMKPSFKKPQYDLVLEQRLFLNTKLLFNQYAKRSCEVILFCRRNV